MQEEAHRPQEEQHPGAQVFRLVLSSGPPMPTPLPSVRQGALPSLEARGHLSLQGQECPGLP